MKLADLQQLSTKELRELAAKEGVVPEGDKRLRINWLIALEKHFEEKEVLNYQPKHYEIVEKDDGDIYYRRRKPKGHWHHSSLGWLALMRRIIELERTLDLTRIDASVAEFRRACVPVRQCTRPP